MEVKRDALVSACGRFRYWLFRQWDASLPPMLFCGLNPSTADAEKDDPTIRKEVGFAQRNGCGSIWKLNLYSYRATDWRELRDAIKRGDDVLGPECSVGWAKAMRAIRDTSSATVVAAWGAHIRSLPGNVERVSVVTDCLRNRSASSLPSYFRGPVHCFGVTRSGDPRHPLMLPYSTPMELYA